MDWIKEENVCEMFNLTRDVFTEMFNAYVRSGRTYPLAYSPPPEKLRCLENSTGGFRIKGGYIVPEEPVIEIRVIRKKENALLFKTEVEHGSEVTNASEQH